MAAKQKQNTQNCQLIRIMKEKKRKSVVKKYKILLCDYYVIWNNVDISFNRIFFPQNRPQISYAFTGKSKRKKKKKIWIAYQNNWI